MSEFEGKVVLITGAAGGIGRSAAVKFAREGARVAVADIDSAGLEQTVEMTGGAAMAIEVDVADYDSCQTMVDKTVDELGGLDILFNNAGISGSRARIADTPLEDWARVININLTGVFYCTRAAIPQMQKAGGGVIINTASVDGLTGMPTIGHYVAAKHGVVGLTKTVALEYARENIRAVAIAPGYVNTKMTEEAFSEEEKALLTSLVPIGRPADVSEIANMALWLASEKASYVTGTCFTVDAGLLSGFNLPG